MERGTAMRELYPHQVVGAEWLASKRFAILADDMGCIDGDAVIHLNRAGRGFKIKLSEAYRRFHGLSGSWDRSIQTRCRALCGNELRQHAMVDILYRGTSEVLEITLKSGKALRLTKDHKVARPGNGWTAAQALNCGDEILTNGRKLYGASNPNWKGGTCLDKSGYVRVSGHVGHPRANRHGQVLEHVLVMESKLKRPIGLNEVIHHLNGVKSDNRLSNLELTTPSAHSSHHGKEGGYLRLDRSRGRVAFVPIVDSIVSVTVGDIIDVYDIVMADPHRNFVANGIIVHNCGKTSQAIIAAKRLGNPTLVIAPAGLKVNWGREAEIVGWPVEVHSWAKIPSVRSGLWTVIADESHYAQSLKSARCKRFLALAREASAVFCLTGTPIKNGRPVNLFPLLVATRHDLGRNRSRYELTFCDAKATKWSRWDVSGASNLPLLHRKLSNVMLRRTKSECLNLPPKVRVMRQVEMSTEARKLYGETLSRLKAEYKQRKAEKIAAAENPELAEAALSAADAIVMLNQLRQAGSLAKVEATVELVQEAVEQGGQVVVFCAFLDTIDALAHGLETERALAGLTPSLITGDMNSEMRQQHIDAFQNGKSNVIVCSIGAGGVGITLTAAQTVIMVDRPWTPGDAAQAEDRLHRIGQTGSVLSVWLQAGRVDAKIDAVLEEKQKRIDLVLAGKAADEAEKDDQQWLVKLADEEFS